MCMMHIDKFHSRMKCVDIYQNEIRKIIQKTSNKRWDSTKFFWDGLIRLVFIWVTLLLLNNCRLDQLSTWSLERGPTCGVPSSTHVQSNCYQQFSDCQNFIKSHNRGFSKLPKLALLTCWYCLELVTSDISFHSVSPWQI